MKLLRRPNGAGTVYKLTGNRSRPWVAKISGYDVFGKRYWHTIGYYATKTEAEKALLHVDLLPTRPNMTFEDVYKEWILTKEGRVSDGCIRVYNSAYKHCAMLYKRKFSELRTAQYQAVIDEVAKTRRGTVSIVQVLFKQLNQYALQNDVINKNYAQFATAPKKEREPREIFTDPEIQAYKKDGSDVSKILLMLIYSGMRINELLKLTVFDIDLKQKTIIGGSKTEAGKHRTIPIHSATLEYWTEAVKNAKDGKLFTITDVQYRKQLADLQNALCLPQKTPHCARHTCATILAREGVQPVIIQQILGHKSYAVTAETYTHFDAETLVAAIEKMR